MRARVTKWGNSLAVRIPRSFADQVGLKENGSVEMSLTEGKLVIESVAEPHVTLEHLLSGVTDENLHHEVDWGAPVGKEGW